MQPSALAVAMNLNDRLSWTLSAAPFDGCPVASTTSMSTDAAGEQAASIGTRANASRWHGQRLACGLHAFMRAAFACAPGRSGTGLAGRPWRAGAERPCHMDRAVYFRGDREPETCVQRPGRVLFVHPQSQAADAPAGRDRLRLPHGPCADAPALAFRMHLQLPQAH